MFSRLRMRRTWRLVCGQSKVVNCSGVWGTLAPGESHPCLSTLSSGHYRYGPFRKLASAVHCPCHAGRSGADLRAQSAVRRSSFCTVELIRIARGVPSRPLAATTCEVVTEVFARL